MLFRTVRMVGPSLATFALAGLLVFTIFFTEFDWQWIAFLSGVLFAAVLSLISSAWKAQWGMAQSAEQTAQVRERLAVEAAMHRQTSERLEREMGLHQQDRERLAKQDEAVRGESERANSAEATLRALELQLPTGVCICDSDLRCRFHTRAFAARVGRQPAKIHGKSIFELIAPTSAETLRTALAEAKAGRATQAELSMSASASDVRCVAELVPTRGGTGKVESIVLVLRETSAGSDAAARSIDALEGDEAAIGGPRPGLRVTDESGAALYLRSLTEELTGWTDPQARIREAIDQDQFDLYAQDIVALHAEAQPQRMLEVLIRMQHEDAHNLPPGAFFPAAEHYGLMPDIDRWVVNKVVAACASVDPERRAQVPLLCINVARQTIEDRGFAEFVARTTAKHGVPRNMLCFEVSDNDSIAATGAVSDFAIRVRQLGCRVSLDGFGSAGVGFAHVKSLRFDFLKIDGRIILAVARDPVAAVKVNAIIRVCRGIGVGTVAEMVESDDVYSKLATLGVDYVQGFGVARPRPLGALV
ncbi:MAG: hypothetical protein A3H32_00370 [Betaproteobacteria bacterium RIFCSPLOWO2_02_FULL_63_19]|nr:MAG: hypothetical protein A3H32_00370 [Betaproteobacteria bacterium RIFCSPLOWO2_02_FULL_63_19]